MNSRFLFPSAFLAGLVFSLLPCAAQDADSVTLQFLSFPKSINPAPVELVIGEGQTIQVKVPSNELSAPYKVKRQRSWVVGETVVGDDGEDAFKVFGKTPALTSSKQLIILVRKGENYSDGFDVIAVDSVSTRFGGGKFLFVNAARGDIAGEVGGQKFALRPGMHTIIKPEPEPGDRKLMQTTLYFRKGENAKPFFNSKWPVSERARGLIFFYHDPNNDRLRLHTIRDFL